MRTDDQGYGIIKFLGSVRADDDWVFATHATAQTDHELIAAVAEETIVVTGVYVSSAAAGQITIIEDTADTKATLLGPINIGANDTLFLPFTRSATEGKNVGFTSTITGSHTVGLGSYQG